MNEAVKLNLKEYLDKVYLVFICEENMVIYNILGKNTRIGSFITLLWQQRAFYRSECNDDCFSFFFLLGTGDPLVNNNNKNVMLSTFL